MARKPLISPSLVRTSDSTVVNQNERAILDVVRREGGTTRSTITAQTHLSQQSVHRLVDRLVERNFLHIGQPVISGRGQPSPVIEINPEAVFGIGISINTDTVRLSIADLNCNEVSSLNIDIDPTIRQTALPALHRAIAESLEASNIPRERVLGVGVAISGYRTGKEDVYVTPAPLESWSNTPLVELFETTFNMPVWVENNASAGAIGESLKGAGQDHSRFAYLSFNDGFGCGLIYDGKPFFGGFNNPGEMGRLYTQEQIRHRPALGELLLRLADAGIHIATIDQLYREFDPTWPGVTAWIAEVKPQLNLAIRALRATMDPTAIVFGGEAPAALKELLIAACDEVDLDRYGREIGLPTYIASALPGDPSTIGAALLPLKDCVLM
ncbi:MAG: ROK family transcriptional regulator [Rhodobacteraceae bacterium]|nr:ROK family transcriptional regulator [Paracoccaceae bacterium]